MATETVEDNKPRHETSLKDKDDDDDDAAAQSRPQDNKEGEENQAAEPKSAAAAAAAREEEQPLQDVRISHREASEDVVNSEEKNVDEKVEESNRLGEKTDEKKESNQPEEEKEEPAHQVEDEQDVKRNGEKEEDDNEKREEDEDDEVEADEKAKAKGRRKGGAKEGQSGSKKSRKETANKKEPATPASDRPTRERKTVERYSVPSPAKSGRSSASKGLSIEKGRGTQLKDIPNVAFKLSKRKPDDNLHMLHGILFGKKAKAHNLKRNIGQFSGYVWVENEEKQRGKVKERIDKCVKEKLVDFCDVLNIPINKANVKKEELSAKLLEFLESPHATTNALLVDKEQKGKKRTRRTTPSKSSGEASIETPAKKQKKTSQVGKKRKQSSNVEEDDKDEVSDAKDESQEDEDVAVPNNESDHEESKLDEEEDKSKVQKRPSKKTVKEGSVAKAGDRTAPVKKTSVKAAKSVEKIPKKSTSKTTVTDHPSPSKSKQPASKKQKTVSGKQDTKGKAASKKQIDKSSKASVKDQGKGKSSKKAKEPSREEMHAVVVDILKEVDFNTATLSDILRQLGTHFGLDLMHRKAEVKDIITDVINNMSDEEDEGEEAENDGDGDADKDDDNDDA